MREQVKLFLSEFKESKELLLLPVFFIILFFGVKYGWTFFGLPTQDEMVATVQNYILLYGVITIFVASLLESMLFVGWYFPGSLVIFLGVSATTGNPILGFKTVLAVCLGMMTGYSINYFLGKYGWYKVLIKFGFKEELIKIEKMLEDKGVFATFFLYIMPGMGCLLSTAFGVLKTNFLKFFAFTASMVFFWNTLWGILVYTFGMKIFNLLTNSYFAIILFIGYLFYLHKTGKLKELTQEK